MIKKILATTVIIALLITSVSIANAKDLSRIRTTVSFDYSLSADQREVIPTVKVISEDYSNGSTQQQSYSFPNQKISVPANASYDEIDPSKPESLRISCGVSMGASHLQMSTGPKAYQLECYSLYNNKTGERTQSRHSRILEFDINTKKLRVLRSVNSNSEYLFLGFEIYDKFKGYAMQTDESFTFNEDYSTKKIQVYSLETNKLIAVVNDYPREDSMNPLTGNYNQVMDEKAVVIEEYELIKGNPDKYSYYVSSNGKNYLVRTFQLYADGHKTELFKNENLASKRWELKVGTIRYAYYYDKKKKEWYVGYSKGGGYIPLSQSNSISTASFSPSNKYLIITDSFIDSKTRKRTGKYSTTIIDTNTAKILYKLPAFENSNRDHGFEWLSDDLVRVSFNSNSYSGYLHVPTGMMTKKGENSFYSHANHYSGNYSDLLTPESPIEILIDGKQVTYAAQGPFRLYNGDDQWMIPLKEFTNRLGAAITPTKEGWQVSRGAQTLAVSRANSIIFHNQSFVPLASLTENLGIVAAMEVNRKVLLFTSQLTEDALKAAFPKATLVDYRVTALIDGKLTDLDEEKRKAYNTYRLDSETLVLFQDGHLLSVIGANYPSKTMRGVEIFTDNGKNALLKKYGAVTPRKDGSLELYTYKMHDYDMTFVVSGDLVRTVHFTIHNQG